jgi:hypothetical protein
MKLIRISRTKRRISASSMRAVERRRSRKLLGRADVILLHWKPVDTCEGVRTGVFRNTVSPRYKGDVEKQPVEIGSKVSILSGHLPTQPPLLPSQALGAISI